MSSQRIHYLPQQLFSINYHSAQYETRLVTSHIWLDSFGYRNELVAQRVLPKCMIPRDLKIGHHVQKDIIHY